MSEAGLAPGKTTVTEVGSQWDRVAAMPEFKQLLKDKAGFIVPATIFFVIYYFLLPVSVGYFPKFMDKRIGSVNLAYLFALSQFFVSWAIAALYVRRASRFDEQSKQLLDKLEQGGK
jgi:uncharacterized membrane protein (DUF485 family)